jgi:hypothetical protein
MQDTFDDILKAQVIYRKMIACATPQDFKKEFSEAIRLHTLDEFYPVVVRAELSAILALSHKEQAQAGGGFDYDGFIFAGFGLKPGHLVGMGTQTVADIMEKDQHAVETMCRDLGYAVEGGKVTGYGDENGRQSKVVQLAERRKAAG